MRPPGLEPGFPRPKRGRITDYPMSAKSPRRDSNPRPADYKSAALPLCNAGTLEGWILIGRLSVDDRDDPEPFSASGTRLHDIPFIVCCPIRGIAKIAAYDSIPHIIPR